MFEMGGDWVARLEEHVPLDLGARSSSSLNGVQRLLLNFLFRCAWVAQSVKHLTLDFGSGHDLRIVRSSPRSGSPLSMEPDIGLDYKTLRS